jgi:hypothetical protein
VCREFWRFAQAAGRIAETFWQWVSVPWQYCSAQPCVWWCLCCNRWVCWLALIALAVLLIVFYVLIVVTFFIALVVCELLCLLFAVLQAPSGKITLRCFQYSDLPVPPANRPPAAQTTGPYNGRVGQAVQMSASGSTDPEGSALTATWDFGDGATGTGLTTSHVYANVGVFNVTVTVSDGSLSGTAVTTATIVGIGGWNPDDPTDDTPI